MMNSQGFCPQCHSEIPENRHTTGSAICECGWFDPSAIQNARHQAEKKTIIAMFGLTVVMALGFGHLVSWGGYAASVPAVKIQQWTGTLSAEGYRELAQACVALNKWDCAKDAYIGHYKKTGRPEGLAELAELYTRLGQLDDAEKMYSTYFKFGGQDGEAALRYAKILEEKDLTEAAFQYYEFAIQARPDVLPIQATTGIVRLLMKIGRYEEAHDRIVEFHESAGNAKGYLNTELTQLENYLDSAGIKRSGKKSRKHSSRHRSQVSSVAIR